MGILAAEVLAIWSLVALATGFGLGAIIHQAERLHEDEFLTALFSNLAKQQAPTSGWLFSGGSRTELAATYWSVEFPSRNP